MNYGTDLRSKGAGISRLVVNMFILEFRLNNYGNCGYWEKSKCYKYRQYKNNKVPNNGACGEKNVR